MLEQNRCILISCYKLRESVLNLRNIIIMQLNIYEGNGTTHYLNLLVLRILSDLFTVS